MDNPIIMHIVSPTVFSLMFAIGVNHSLQQLTSLWRQPALLLRSLLAVVVLVPVMVVFLLWLFDLPPAAATGLAVLAAAPGAPMTTKRSQMAGGDPTYTASLQLTLALLAVVITPFTLSVFYALFAFVTERVTPFQVALQVAEVTFLPVVIGLLVQRFAPRIAAAIGTPVQVFANVLFILLFVVIIVVFAIAPDLLAKLNVGALSMAAIIIMVVVSLAGGHLLGGPLREQRSALAIASIARNVGLALFIAGLSAYGQEVIPTILAYMILGAFVAVPYSLWSKRSMTKEGTRDPAVSL